MPSRLAADDVAAERVAHNDAAFRAANERIDRAARQHEMRDGVPFLCECAEPSCRELVALSLDEYAEIRSDARHFFNVPGHQTSGGPHVQVIARRDRYVIVEKVGRAGEVAEELDPRRED